MKKLENKKIGITAIMFLISTFSISSTLSFLTRTTSEVSNTFKKGSVGCEIVEQFDGKIKSSIKIKNSSTIVEFIRVKIVSNYIDNDGIISATKVKGIDLKTSSNWELKNGIYYYKESLMPGKEVELLAEPLILEMDKNGKRQVVEVLSSAVQAYPEDAVEDAWKVNIESGRIQ